VCTGPGPAARPRFFSGVTPGSGGDDVTGSPSGFVGVDVGGTFTDLILVRPDGLVLDKRPTTAPDPATAVVAALDALDPGGELAVAHGTTVATNALLERAGARTAFIATRGFADLLALGRGERAALYDLAPAPRPVLVPRELCLEVDERLAADGAVVRPLTDAATRAVASAIADLGVDAVAVCLLFAYLAPDHERRIGAALARAVPGVHVSLSVDVHPEYREYERASTTVVNAYVAPAVAGYLGRLGRSVAPRPLTIMASHAGVLPPGVAARLPVSTVLSGPAAGVLGALAVARRAGRARIVTFDMGGTSTDVALCDDAVPFTQATVVGGVPVHHPAVDVHTVGAGGGSIVCADPAGALLVGPRSAGAVPGPAAYGRGGRAPTVTDANVVLGRLPAAVPLASGLRLDAAAARTSLRETAAALGLTVEACALGALAVVNARMERALRRVSVERGFDPGELTLVAFGGAGPLHACALAEAIGARDVLVPSTPGALSALGLATAPPVAMAARSVLGPRGEPRIEPESVWPELIDRARADLGQPALSLPGTPRGRGRRAERVPPSEPRVEHLADLRYAGQSWEITVPWPPGSDVRAAFEAAHGQRYGYVRPGAPIEIVTLRVRLTGAPRAPLPAPPPHARSDVGRTTVILEHGVAVEAPIIVRSGLLPGSAIDGPAVITQLDATTYLAPGWSARVGPYGDLHLVRSGRP
jgi:N-methylhydantoinase A